MHSTRSKAANRAYALLREQITPYRAAIALAVLLMILESLAALASPWFAGQFSKALFEVQSSGTQVLALWVGVLAIQALLKIANGYLLALQGARIVTDLSRRVYDHLQHLPLRFHVERKPGELLALLSNDAAILGHFVTGPLVGLLPQLLVFLGAVVMMARIDGLIAAAAALTVPVFLLSIKLLGRRIRPLAVATTREQAETVAVVEETLAMLPVIKAFSSEAVQSARFREQTQTVLDLRTRQFRIQSVLGPLVQLLAGMLMLVLLWLAGDRLAAGLLTSADLVSLVLYALLMTRPVSGLASLYGQARQAQGALDRVRGVMAERPEPVGDHGTVLNRVNGRIEFQGVGFHYPGRAPLLSDLDLALEAGERVAITGANGAGKSTLVALLMRLLDPAQGVIRVDGHDIREVNLSSLRRQFGYVPQQVLIANGTIRQNITFGMPDATDEAIRAAARAAQADAFIQRLPDGYATPVGDKGAKLSGGQRQRIALARALLLDAPILVLDEATATFDPAGEAAFVTAGGSALRDRTVIIITHRPVALALADRQLVLREGKLTPREAASRSAPAVYAAPLSKLGTSTGQVMENDT